MLTSMLYLLRKCLIASVYCIACFISKRFDRDMPFDFFCELTFMHIQFFKQRKIRDI